MAASVESSKQTEFSSAGKIDTQAMPAEEEDDFRRTEESSEDATDNEKSAVSSADESGTKSETEEDNEQKKENAATKAVVRKEKPKGNGDFIFTLDTNAAEVVKSDGLRRERKQVERFAHIPVKHEEKPIIISTGSGVKLGEIEYIAHQINKHKPADLTNLHRLFYDRRGTATQIKKNIRLFSGFPFEDKSAEFIKKKKQMIKWNPKVVREICDVLGVQKRASKDLTIDGVLEFCLQPSDKGKKLASKLKKTSSSKSKGSPSKTKKATDSTKSEPVSGKKEKGVKRKLASSGSGSEQDEVVAKSATSGKSKSKEPPSKKSREGPTRKASVGKIYAEDEEEELERMVSDSESDFKSDEEKPKKKTKPKPVKPKPSNSNKKSPTKKTSKASKPPDSDSDGVEPKNAKKSKEPVKIPTDDDLKKSVQKIIENSDLKKVSMRMVLDQVFAEYPGVDLLDKKALIKSLVQEILP